MHETRKVTIPFFYYIGRVGMHTVHSIVHSSDTAFSGVVEKDS